MSLTKESTLKLREKKMEIPVIGYDTTFDNLDSETRDSEIKAALSCAIDAGYRLIFCDPKIPGNEAAVGKTLKKKMEEMKLERKDFFIVTKVYLDLPEKAGFVGISMKKSLENLGFDYVDLLLLNCNVLGNYPYVDYTQSWLQMEDCHFKKFTKSLGFINFTQYKIENILKFATVKPSVNMINCNVLMNLKEMRDFLRKHKIVSMTRNPYGAVSIITHNPRNYSPDKVHLNKVVPLKELAEKYNKTNCQIAIRYLLEIGTIPLVKSGMDNSIMTNIDVFDFKMNEDDMKILNAIDDGKYDPNLKLYNVYPEDYAQLGLRRLNLLDNELK